MHASNFSLSQNRGIYFVLGIFGTQLKKFFILRQKTKDFVTFTEEILIGKLYLLYTVTDTFCSLNKMLCRLPPSWRQPKNLKWILTHKKTQQNKTKNKHANKQTKVTTYLFQKRQHINLMILLIIKESGCTLMQIWKSTHIFAII